MVRARGEQRRSYEGIPPRCCASIVIVGLDGRMTPLKVVVDTGSPYSLVISDELLRQNEMQRSRDAATNFGPMIAGWVRVMIPEVHVDAKVQGYGSNSVVRHARESHRTFDGLIGLPLLRMTEYGGDADFFWLRESMR